MNDHDSLHDMLREWKAPEPPAALETRLRAAYREKHRRWTWHRSWSALWKTRISVPVPALAALVLLALAWILEVRPVPAPAAPRADRGYLTRLDDSGFQPLPNGAARVVPVGAVPQ